MASFLSFYEQITAWLEQNHSLIILKDLCRPSLQAPETNPQSRRLWENYLAEVLPVNFSRLFRTNQSIKEDLLQKLLGLSHYGLDRKASHLIEQSFLRFLPRSDQSLLSDRIVVFYSQLNNWIDGFWNDQIITGRFSNLQKLVDDLAFPDKWSGASFLVECGYKLPRSQSAYQVWLKWSGEQPQGDEYEIWLNQLLTMDSNENSMFLNDSILDLVFSPQDVDLWPTLCVKPSDCWVCPLQNNCIFFSQIAIFDSQTRVEDQIRTGNMSEIETNILLEYLAGNRLHKTSGQLKLVTEFPELNSITAADFKKESDEEKLFLFFVALRELSERLKQSKTLIPGVSFSNSADIFDYAKHKIRDNKQEMFHTLILDNKHRVIRLELITKGTLNQSLVHPREVFVPAIQLRAAAIVLIHNHPSGDPKPSLQDKQITKRLQEVGDLVGIKVLDHLIIGKDSYFSFVDENLLN